MDAKHERYWAAARGPLARGFMQGRLRQYVARELAELGAVSEERRYRLGLVDRANYAFGLLTAAREARSLGYQGITAIEFGVGAGNGLLAMERHASATRKLMSLGISVVGFDTGAGLPEPVDYRDSPYCWGTGFYPMDIQRLRERLSSARLVLGDVKETVRDFLRENERELSERPPHWFRRFRSRPLVVDACSP